MTGIRVCAFSVLTLAVNQAVYAEGQSVAATTPGNGMEAGEVVVVAPKGGASLMHHQVSSGDAGTLLAGNPGVSLYFAGGISSLPAIHGLADDRVKVLVDGMQVSSACANHMNPALSYIAPINVGKVDLIAGVTPVSRGGDSLGGTILVESIQPAFADAAGELRKDGSLSLFSRSVNHSSGAAASASVASESLSFGVTGSIDHAGNYKDGLGNAVTSTYYDRSSLGLNLAAKGEGSLVTLKAGTQFIPGQGFVNQQMDMTSNRSSYFNLGYKGDFAWGALDARAYWQDTRHGMNVGRDKSTLPGPMFMPMNSHGKDIGYAVQGEVALAENNVLRIGQEFHRFSLDDSWPAVNAGPGMGPSTFININGGRRDRISLFAELESKLNSQFTTLFGLRNDRVRSDTGNVQGYSALYAVDAAAFNAQPHARQDSNWNATGLLKFEPATTSSYELGYDLKMRSPNLYERYSWATDLMSSGMVGWFGDGNYYIGNQNLRPEKAHTLSVSADWHDATRKQWELKVTPYYTYIRDYIGVNLVQTVAFGSTFSQLQFTNHNAQLHGVDVSGKVGLWDNGYGYGQLKGSLSYLRGKDLTVGGNLYHTMPLNASFALEQNLAAWSNAVELKLVGRKSQVDAQRFEPLTGGYALLNLRSGYEWKGVRLDLSVTNLLNKQYNPPLGGVNFDNYLKTSWAGMIQPLAGPGRSINAGLTFKF